MVGRGVAWWSMSLLCRSLTGFQFLDMVIDMPAFVHVVFVVLKTVEVPQLQYRQGCRCLLRAVHRRVGVGAHHTGDEFN